MASFKKYLLIVVFFVFLGAIMFRAAWGPDQVFYGSDSNVGQIASAHRLLPHYFSGAYYSRTLFGGAATAPFNILNIGKWLLPPEVFSDTYYAFYLIVSSLFLLAYLRIWELRWSSCLLGAVSAFWVGSVTLSAAGHLGKLGVMALFSVALFVLETSLRAEGRVRRILYAMLGGTAIGFMLLEQQDVGLFAGLFLGAYVLFRLIQVFRGKLHRWLEVLLPVAVIGLAMAAPTALNAYSKNVTGTGMQSDPAGQWNFITQWSMVPREMIDVIAPGYSGWKTGDQEAPYWGAIGRSPEWESTKQGFRNFRLDGIYMGIIPIALAMASVVMAVAGIRQRRPADTVVLFWGVAALAALLLSLGKYSPVYKLFYQLPLVGNIRAPIKFLHNFQVVIGILAAFGVEAIFCGVADDSRKHAGRLFKVLAAVAGMGAVFTIVVLASGGLSIPEDFNGEARENLTANMVRALVHFAVMAGLLAVAGYLFWKGRIVHKNSWVAILVLTGAVTADAVYLSSRYFTAYDISSLRKGNAAINYLKQQQGNDRLFLMDNRLYNGWRSLEVPYHDLNTFGIWQMPRMPADYRTFLETAGSNQLRMWQLASVKYLVAPASLVQQLLRNEEMREQLGPELLFRFVRQGDSVGVVQIQQLQYAQDQAIVRLRDTLPRFALMKTWRKVPVAEQCPMLFAEEFNPLETVLVDDAADLEEAGHSGGDGRVTYAETTAKDAVVKTESDTPSVLLFTQRHQPGWRVYIDGQAAELLKCNFLCMGVYVPAGAHEVRFVYK
jgi:hypothetical protein